MNYEDTKITMAKAMQEWSFGKATQKKCLIILNQICKRSEKYHDTSLLNLSDARSFFDFLQNDKKAGPSTMNNSRSAMKFIYTAILKKSGMIFPSRTSTPTARQSRL